MYIYCDYYYYYCCVEHNIQVHRILSSRRLIYLDDVIIILPLILHCTCIIVCENFVYANIAHDWSDKNQYVVNKYNNNVPIYYCYFSIQLSVEFRAQKKAVRTTRIAGPSVVLRFSDKSLTLLYYTTWNILDFK